MSRASTAIRVGDQYGRLTVIKRIGTNKVGQVEYLARCECGNAVTVLRSELCSGDVFSCGCPVKPDETEERSEPFSFDYAVVEFVERCVRGKIQVIALDGRILDERPLMKGEYANTPASLA